jgi:hypothetical protein
MGDDGCARDENLCEGLGMGGRWFTQGCKCIAGAEGHSASICSWRILSLTNCDCKLHAICPTYIYLKR